MDVWMFLWEIRCRYFPVFYPAQRPTYNHGTITRDIQPEPP